MINEKTISEKVLEFYKELPFNIYSSTLTAAKKVKDNNVFTAYPVLKKIFLENRIKNLIDVGSGGGWFVNSLASTYKDLKPLGIDFNPTAINYAKEVSKELSLNSQFILTDLFEYKTEDKFDLISSIGVLHHTHDCLGGIKKITKLGSSGSILFLGLYHKYGRKPFLNFVKEIENLSENEKFHEYKKLHKLKDEIHLKSWFRDQVLIPHETQHTYEEISILLQQEEYKILSTSINKFQKINSNQEIIDLEKKLYDIGLERINNSQYYPGFFIILAQKI